MSAHPSPVISTTSQVAVTIDRIEVAMQAWRAIRSEGKDPTSIEVLRDRSESTVLRLLGAGPSRGTIVARRCRARTALLERTIHVEILPNVPVPAVAFLGSAPDADPSYAWLFLEDAGSEPYWVARLDHRLAATRWLAALHLAGPSIPIAEHLPDRGPGHYLGHLRSARELIIDRMGLSCVGARDRETLSRLGSELERMEHEWPAIEALCEAGFRTIVQGDLSERNVRVGQTARGAAVFPLSWRDAGWGIPAVDVAKCPEMGLYGRRIRPRWPVLDAWRLRRLFELGVVFRTLSAIDRHAGLLRPSDVAATMQGLRTLRYRLAGALACVRHALHD